MTCISQYLYQAALSFPEFSEAGLSRSQRSGFSVKMCSLFPLTQAFPAQGGRQVRARLASADALICANTA